VFAASDDEALKTLRVTQVEAIVKDAFAPLREVPRFIARARHVCPSAVVICVLPAGESSEDDESAAEAADFVLLQPFTSRHLQDIVRQAEEKLRLLEEVAAFRSSRGTASGNGHEGSILGLEASSHALTQVAKEFAKALAAGFDLPRVLARSRGRWRCCRPWSPSRSSPTASWWPSSRSGSASPVGPTAGARRRSSSASGRISPPPSATSASITSSNTRRSSTSASSR